MAAREPEAPNPTFEDQATRRVSYVLPTRNRAGIIETALERLTKLVGPEDELVVVDGASTDGTAEILAGYGPPVNVLISEPDSGVVEAQNKGLLLARGTYIKWVTDDDEFYPEAMERAVEILDANPEIDVLLCGGTRELDGQMSYVYVPPGAGYGKSPRDVFRYTGSGMGLIHRRRVLAKVGLVQAGGIAADGEFLAAAIAAGAVVKFCRLNMFHHPLYAHSVVVSQQRDYRRDMVRISRQYCGWRFALRYRAKTILGGWRAARWLFSLIRRRAPQADPVWDGGFS